MFARDFKLFKSHPFVIISRWYIKYVYCFKKKTLNAPTINSLWILTIMLSLFAHLFQEFSSICQQLLSCWHLTPLAKSLRFIEKNIYLNHIEKIQFHSIHEKILLKLLRAISSSTAYQLLMNVWLYFMSTYIGNIRTEPAIS